MVAVSGRSDWQLRLEDTPSTGNEELLAVLSICNTPSCLRPSSPENPHRSLPQTLLALFRPPLKPSQSHCLRSPQTLIASNPPRRIPSSPQTLTVSPSSPQTLIASNPPRRIPSSPQTLTVSLPQTLIAHCLKPSLPQTLIPSNPHCFKPSSPHPFLPSSPETLTVSLPQTLIVSLPQTLIATVVSTLFYQFITLYVSPTTVAIPCPTICVMCLRALYWYCYYITVHHCMGMCVILCQYRQSIILCEALLKTGQMIARQRIILNCHRSFLHERKAKKVDDIWLHVKAEH